MFQDPFEFHTHKDRVAKVHQRDSILVPLNIHHDQALDFFLAQNPHIRQVDLVFSSHGDRGTERDEVERLKKHLDPFAIQVRGIEIDSLSRGRSHGPDIGF